MLASPFPTFTPAMTGSLVMVGLGVAGLLFAERQETNAMKCVFKPIASTGFVLLGLSAGALATPYGRWVMVALALGWLGDALLLSTARLGFLAGLGSFLLGHAAFGAGFVARGIAWPVTLVAGVALAFPGRALRRWLEPSVPADMRLPVIAYLSVILAMVALAAGTAWATPGWSILVAAVMFALSDVSVARDRFMNAGWTNKAWGLPLYYAAQCVLAVGAGG
jgi:uncharacterized membrane protein YhhN